MSRCPPTSSEEVSALYFPEDSSSAGSDFRPGARSISTQEVPTAPPPCRRARRAIFGLAIDPYPTQEGSLDRRDEVGGGPVTS